MKRMDFRAVVGLAFLVAACQGDPTADLRGGPAILSLNPNLMFIDNGDSRGFEVTVRDQQLNPVASSVTATSTNPAVFTIAPDTTVPSADGARHSFTVDALTNGRARIAVSGGGLNDTATVSVLPVVFPGVVVGNPVIGQLFTVVITDPLFSFDIAKANIDFGDGVLGDVIRATAESLTVRVSQPDETVPLQVQGLAVSYVPGLVMGAPTAPALLATPVGDRKTPGAVIITPPASGGPDLVFWDGFKSGANGETTFIDYYYQFTLATTDTLTFTLDWEGAADLDMANLTSSFGFIGGFGAATGANPETYTVIFPAGTYHLLIESFDDHDETAHLFRVTIHNP